MVYQIFFISLISLMFFAGGLFSADYTVDVGTDTSVSTGGAGTSTTGELRYVLNQILNAQAQAISADSHTISFTIPTVTLTALPPPINLFQSDTIIIGNSIGSPTVIDGGSSYRPFFIRQGTVTLQNLTIQNGKAQGGNGLDGGGGGMGAGGALFVDAANVTINNVSFSSNVASSGLSNSGQFGAGGGLGGKGGGGTFGSGGGV